MKIYHVALVKKNDRVIVQLRQNVDLLSCEAWKYLGEIETTKKQATERKAAILASVNAQYHTNFERITID